MAGVVDKASKFLCESGCTGAVEVVSGNRAARSSDQNLGRERVALPTLRYRPGIPEVHLFWREGLRLVLANPLIFYTQFVCKGAPSFPSKGIVVTGFS